MSQEQRLAANAAVRTGPQGFRPQPIEDMRAGFAEMMATFAVPTDVSQTATTLAGRPAVRVEPVTRHRPGTILYFHGGSFALGSPQTAMVLTANLVRRTGIAAISLDYRLAPENPFPAAIEDCVAAYRSLLDAGTPPSSVAFAGDSAGGGLTITTCLAARDADLPLPAAIVAFSPGLDHTRSGGTMDTKDGIDPFFTKEGMDHSGRMYVGDADPHQPLIAPAVYADLTGFPPILVQVGTNELLLDDAVRLADRARDVDVDVILDVTAGVPHVFQAMVDTLDEADQALDRAALFLSQQVRTTTVG